MTPGINKTRDRLILHSTVSPCVEGGADATCAYFRGNSAGGSSHYVVDPGAERQCVWDDDEAWHAPGAAWSRTSHPSPPNVRSLAIEMCDMPVPKPAGAHAVGTGHPPVTHSRLAHARRSWRWVLPNQRRMLRRTALLSAELCLANDFPIQFLTVQDLLAGKRGISVHANVSKAFGLTDHWDPGWWPRRWYMRMTRKYAQRIRNGENPDVIRKEI